MRAISDEGVDLETFTPVYDHLIFPYGTLVQ